MRAALLMSEATQIREDTPPSILTGDGIPLTPLAGTLDAPWVEARGARTVAAFSDAAQELSALVSGVAAFDQGARVRLRVSGEDRVRWLNGMVTNAVKALALGTHHYTFVLNAQGRIQGDATIFAFADHLILETDRAQADRLFAHLDRFIIMDDVELAWMEGQTTLGLAGPSSAALLQAVGLPVPSAGTFAAAPVEAAGTSIVVAEYSPSATRFSLWVAGQGVASLWQRLLAAGATPAGATAVDALRVLEGTPLYGIDITEKTLAQETGQTRALNFNKGCYLGQEIVERVRSLAKVHRGIRQFALHGEPAAAGAPLTANGAAVGELTSVAGVPVKGAARMAAGIAAGQIALGIVRIEALGRSIEYPGGTVEVLPALHTGS